MIGYQRLLYILPQNIMKFYTLLLLFVIFFAAVSAWNPFPDDMKTSWPELVGKDADEAVAVIKSECEDCKVRVRPEHSPMTMDLRIDRVRVLVNQDNIVVVEPRRGYECLLNTCGI